MQPIKTYLIDDLVFKIRIKGDTRYGKTSYPVRYGLYSEVIAGPFVFQFNLNGEIKHAQFRDSHVMELGEWMKRTMGNDWVFYSSGGYNGAFEAVGEYYIPCFPYESNGILGGKPFKNDLTGTVLDALSGLMEKIRSISHVVTDPDLICFLQSVLSYTPERLEKKTRIFHELTGGVTSVLPPDARHVDYDVIPVQISRGCLYNCRFCTVKSGKGFSTLPFKEIENRISGLKQVYGEDIINYNSLFIGQHDALHAGSELIVRTAMTAFHTFGFGSSIMSSPRLFLFASADSFIAADESVFHALNRLPYESYINIGFESADDNTLKLIGKPINRKKVKMGFSKMEYINRTYPRIEVTSNFLYSDEFPLSHMDEFYRLVHDQYPKPYSKGAIYLSPYGKIIDRKSLVTRFKGIKGSCKIPAYLYIIQRL